MQVMDTEVDTENFLFYVRWRILGLGGMMSALLLPKRLLTRRSQQDDLNNSVWMEGISEFHCGENGREGGGGRTRK